jgi:hypothetical protein
LSRDDPSLAQLADEEKVNSFLDDGMSDHRIGRPKGVGPSTTLAWPGWKQPYIAVKVDTDRHDSK